MKAHSVPSSRTGSTASMLSARAILHMRAQGPLHLGGCYTLGACYTLKGRYTLGDCYSLEGCYTLGACYTIQKLQDGHAPLVHAYSPSQQQKRVLHVASAKIVRIRFGLPQGIHKCVSARVQGLRAPTLNPKLRSLKPTGVAVAMLMRQLHEAAPPPPHRVLRRWAHLAASALQLPRPTPLGSARRCATQSCVRAVGYHRAHSFPSSVL